ncbi:MBL fold metallo-hydrolase [Longimicrobium sp.]|uniref:MBL fold metallo-hydrolase n=1 Tax=Longimicrobium sp. TaxID=2029185 RepID=UPI003B3A17C2
MQITALGVWTHSYAGPTTSFHVDYGDVRILLDTGVDPIGRMRELSIQPTECTHLFLSHLHSDHSSGFSNFVFTRELLGRSLDGGGAPLTILGSAGVLEGCRALLDLQYPDRKFNVLWKPLIADGEIGLTDQISIRTVETIHSVECHGCRLSASGGVDVGFTADTAPSEEHIAFFADCGILLGEAFGTEARVGQTVNKRGHSTAEDLGHLVSKCKPSWVMPFHFGPECADLAERKALLKAASGGRSDLTMIDPVASPRLSI